MSPQVFERLLYEEESTTIDFKKEQYRFVKASDEDKSELLKDILGFSNAWRRTESYILIGVEDVRGGRGNVVGIPATDHLDDHSLQQFVNNLTNRPIHFHYEAFGFEGKRIGIIRIDEQQSRPLFLKKDYGKLKKDEVYVRRGSSTDPTKPASIDEIALMGHSSAPNHAELTVEFAEIDSEDSLGTIIDWEAEYCEMPPLESIPDFDEPRQRHPLGIDLSVVQIEPMNRRINRCYLRELATYEFTQRLFRPVRLVVKNVGRCDANRVRAELTVPTKSGVILVDPADMPDSPKRRSDMFSNLAIKKIPSAVRRGPGSVSIERNEKRIRFEIECGDQQPGRMVWTDVFYLGIKRSGEHKLAGHLYAANLPEPKEFTLSFNASVRWTTMSVNQLRDFGKQEPESDEE